MAVNNSQQNGEATPVIRQNLPYQVYERLCAMIVSGALAISDPFPSGSFLRNKFGVGRLAVREAIQTPSNNGVITISQGERRRVNELKAAIAVHQVNEIAKLLLYSEHFNLTYLKQVRKILETGAVKLAAQICARDDATHPRSLIDAQRVELRNHKSFILADITFHVVIAELSYHFLLEVVKRVMLTSLHKYYMPVLHQLERGSSSLWEHVKLVDYLENLVSTGAIQLIDAYVDRSNPLFAAKVS